MKTTAVLFSVLGTVAATASAAQQPTWIQPSLPAATTASQTCAAFSQISGTFSIVAGTTNGIAILPQSGERFTIQVSGSATGSFRIVGDPAGTVTFAGPSSVPGTLTYTASAPFPPGTVGVGYYFDSGNEGTVTLTASCVGGAAPAPALGGRGMLLLGALLALIGGVSASRWMRRSC